MKQIIVDNISTTYYITEDGKCYNSITGKFLKGQVNIKNGYRSFNLTIGDKCKRCYAHRLVAIAYLPNPDNKKEVNHIDGNKDNNCIDNLAWVTSSENKIHAIQNELRRFKHVYCFNSDKKLVAEYLNGQDAAAAVKVSTSIIFGELRKEIKELSGGFYWSYSKEIGETKSYPNLGKAKQVNQYDKNNKFIMTYPSLSTAARALNASASHIGECCRGKLNSYKGYKWKYVEDIVLTSDKSLSAPQVQ